MITRINHIAVAVSSLSQSADLFARLFGAPAAKTEFVASQNATVAFFPVGESSVELIESASPDSSIAKFIEKRGEGIHHLCLETDDIRAEMQRLTAAGFQFLTADPFEGGDGHLVAFIHPKSANGVLIEVSQKTGGTH